MSQVASTAGKKAGLQIWRVENFSHAVVPDSQHGNFFSGDCYLILNTKASGTSFVYDLHYWIGKDSAQDEQGAVAIFATQLDDHLRGLPTQHREMESYESKQFRSYFPAGIIYKAGGVSSGFSHVETNKSSVRRLLHVKGNKNVIAREVPLSWSSFNDGDVFIIDIGQGLIQWNAPNSNRQERMKGGQLARCVRDRERGGRIPIVTIDPGTESQYPKCQELMRELLGPPPSKLPKARPDDVVDRKLGEVKLYHISDSSGQLVVTEIAQRPLVQSMLSHDDCYCLDNSGQAVFVWKGRKASKEEKSSSMEKALKYIQAKGYGKNVQLEVVNDGSESALFRSCFKGWKDAFAITTTSKQTPKSNVAKVEVVKFDVQSMHKKPQVAAQTRMVDDGSGQVDVFRVEQNSLVPVEEGQRGKFYGGDCYIVFYTYMVGEIPNYIIYIWQGRHAGVDEITASAYLAVELDRQFRDEPTQIRVTMGKEPRHFMAMFGGKMLVYEGGTGRSTVQSYQGPSQLFQVRGVDEVSTKAFEVMPVSASLNSSDVFVLISQQFGAFLWLGRASTGDERAMGRKLALHLTKMTEIDGITEGQEPQEFWAALGGRTEYFSTVKAQEDLIMEPRLFECSNATGTFQADEVFNFTQDDLDEDDVMLLDTWNQLFIWVGANANKIEKEKTAVAAYEYLQTDPAGRDADTNIIIVKQGREPPTFTGWFLAWDTYKWSYGKTYEDIKAEMGSDDLFKEISLDELSNKVQEKHDSDEKITVLDGSVKRYLSYEELKNIDPEKALGIDLTKREYHLNESEFEPVFGISRESYDALPQWKKDKLKRSVGLF